MADINSTVTYRDIPGFIGYRVGDDGSVWSQRKKGVQKSGILTGTWIRMKTSPARGGYPRVGLRKNRKQYLVTIPVLVALAFLGPKPKGKDLVAHENGNPLDNSPTNLRYKTYRENSEDRERHGRTARGERQGKAKLTAEIVLAIRADYAKGGITQEELAKKYGVYQTAISRVVRREFWRHI
jgi:hypothetical protein